VVWCSGWGRVETGASSRIEQGEGAAAYRHEALSEGVFKVGARAHGAIVARLHAEKGEGGSGVLEVGARVAGAWREVVLWRAGYGGR
jgi:hypothetical protein